MSPSFFVFFLEFRVCVYVRGCDEWPVFFDVQPFGGVPLEVFVCCVACFVPFLVSGEAHYSVAQLVVAHRFLIWGRRASPSPRRAPLHPSPSACRRRPRCAGGPRV